MNLRHLMGFLHSFSIKKKIFFYKIVLKLFYFHVKSCPLSYAQSSNYETLKMQKG